ncbi:T9SS type A sorting domain-containing protein [Gaetbulibacter jejuensis]|uniref:T9SS type A sorting domain-containing protein n=1 Tax=Gaetbulibacter jejuensis TaxID=584607 RepID=UPI00300B11F0
MSNFTRSRGSAIKWRPTTNLWCCSIDFFTRHFKSMKALAFIMLFVFSSGSMLGQSNELMERSTYLNRCMDEAPVGPTAAEVGGMYVEICDGITPTVTKSSAWVQPSTDCDWEIIHTYDIVCGDFEEQFKIHYTGGDQTAPILNEDAVIPSGGSDLNVCFDEIPEGPSESDIRDLFSDNCGDVIVVKSGEPTGSDCAWSVTYKYEITDECGNTASPIDISYSGGDTDDPVLVGVPEDETVSCIDEIPDAPQVTATDNCADNLVVTLEEDDSNLGTFCDGGTLVRTWTVTDECDHTVSMSQTITVEPTPETYFLNTPDNISISCDEAGSYQPSSLAYTNGVDSGACAINGEVAGELSGNYTECGGYLKVTWSYTDECEREITYVQDITVEPAPMAAFESVSDEEITCDEAASYEAGYLAYTNDAETEACLIAGEVAGELSGSYTECGGELMVTWTFMDDCQREITATKTITVLPAPVAEFAPVEDEEITCDEAATYSAGFLTYNNGAETDACYISGKVKGSLSGSYTECGGELIATWTYTDDCNRQIIASKTITVLPAPVAEFAPVEDEVISCDEAGSYSAGFLTYNNGAETKSCYISGKVEGVITGSYTECGGELLVTWTYVDDCQREITATKTVTVEPAPMASFESVTDEEITCDEAATYTAGYLSYNNNAETKACSISGEVEGELSGSYTECGGELQVTWTYVDDCQREITATKTVTVLPAPAAMFDDVTDEEITCDEAAYYKPEYLAYTNDAGSDTCLIEGEVLGEISGEYNECGGTLTVTWFYKDNCEREITASKTVTVLPAPAAEFAPVENEEITCDEAASYVAGYLSYSNNAGTEACLISGEVEGEITGTYSECGGTLTVTWFYKDDCEREITATKTVTVLPAPAAEFAPVENEEITCDEAASYVAGYLSYSNNAETDACLIAGEVEGELSGTYTECGGELLVTWTFMDDCQREITATKTVTVLPAPAAEFAPVEDEEITCDEAASYAAGYLSYSNNAETDACLIAGEVEGEITGTYSECGGTLTVTWFYKDDCEREITATKTVTVLPAPAAEFAPVEDEEITCDEAASYVAGYLSYSNDAETDTCLIAGEVEGEISGEYNECGGELMVTWTFMDDCQREITATKIVTVLPAPAAEFAPVEDEEITCDEAASYAAGYLSYSNNAETDACLIAGEVEGELSGTYSECGGTLTVTWFYKDNCEREITATKTVTVLPAPAAEFAPVEDEEITCDEAASYVAGYLSYSNNAETDACLIAGEVEGELTGTYTECGGELLVTWTFMDDCQREITATKTVTVLPAPAAEFAPVEDEEITCEEANVYEATYLSYTNDAGTEACLIEGEVLGEISGEYNECGGTLTVTWFYKDDCEREITTSKTVTVLPAPVAEFDQVDDITIACEDLATYEPAYLAYSNGGTVSCEISGEVQGVAEPFDGSCGMFEVNWSFTDECGRTITANRTVTVIDETAPVLVGELPEGISNIDACYADHPTEPTEEEIAALFEDNCGNVNVTKTVVSLGDDCDWAVMFRYEVQDDCGNFAAPVKVYYNGGDKTAPELTGTLPTGETGMELCFDEIPEAPKSSNLAELYTENCSEVIVTELEPVITGDNCYWTATYTYTVEDACGNKAENIVIYYQGGDTTPPVLEGDVPMGQNSLDLCIDSDLGEPSEEDIAALYSDNCSEVITVNKIEKVYGTDCEWIRVFEYIAMDECGNESDIIKVNYQGGDQSPPVFDLECQLESFEIFTSNGADCPAEAGISLNIGDEIDAFTSWTVGGVEILPIGSCVSDNCTDLGDIIIRVIGKTSTDDNCINMLSISFEAEDACGKISEPFTCTYKVIDDEAPEAPADEEFTYECTDDVPEAIDLKAIDACQGEIEGVFSETSDGQTCPETITRTWTYDDGCGNISVTTHVITVNDVTAPVLECPEDVDFGVVTETPTGFADKAFYTDNCIADGATHDYTDSEITETVNSSSVEGEYIFTFEEGYLLNLGNAPAGTTSDGQPYYSGVITSLNGDVLPNYGTILVVYNSNSGEYDILQDFGGNNIQPAGTANADAFDGCDATAWSFTSNTGHNKAFTLECPVYSSSITYTFTRTFTAADDCGNEDECSVTYTWTIEVGCDEEAPVIECPDDANFGENPDLDINGVPYGVATTANYTDNMDEDGVTTTYTDELSSEEYYGESTNFDISCIQNGSLFALVHFERTGYAEDGYAIYADGYREDYPQYTYDLYYNHSTNRWEVYEYDNGYLLGLVWYNVTEDTAPSCNPSDWDIDGSVCDGIYVDCGYYYLDYTEYTLTRTFTQTDSCGNEGECSVTYTWVEGTEAENRQSNETTYSTTSNGAQIYAGEVSEERVSEALDFTAYPVPFDKEVNISYTFDFETNVTIELFDTKGLLILSDTNNRYVAGSKGNTRFDLSRTSNQMFYVKLTTSQGSVTKKIVSSSVKRH